MADITCVEVNQVVEGKLKLFGKSIAESIVKYVDGKETVLREELKNEIVKELSGIEGLGSQLEKIQEMAEAFAKAFDANEDGLITPQEILAKATLLQQAIDGVNGRVDALSASIDDIKKAIEDEIENLKARISALEVSTSKNSQEIANIKADLTANYVTMDCLSTALDVNVQTAIDAFNAILFPEDDVADGDGAVE